MTAEPSKETGEEQVGSLIDDLIHDIFKESGMPSETSPRGMTATAALFEAAAGSGRGARFPALERLLIVEEFAAELADALAPALADQLAPRLMKALEQVTAAQGAGKQPASAGRAGNQSRKPEAR